MWTRVSTRLHARSIALRDTLEARLSAVMLGWLVLAMLASAARIQAGAVHAPVPALSTILPYALLVIAPLASLALALHWFDQPENRRPPARRMATVGRWRSVDPAVARRHPLYGTSGLMVSLMIGMLLNVPVRSLEYLAAVPVLSGRVPSWLSAFHVMMTLDAVLLSSLYVVAFAAALRRAPIFPRLLVIVWVVDLSMQLAIAQVVGQTSHLPQPVAQALSSLLDGNCKKVLISIALWLPYLILSRRVNLTYRSRLPA